MKHSQSCLIFMFAIVLMGCVPDFENPLPPPANLKSDDKMVGNWVCDMSTNEKVQLSIFARQSGWMDFVYVHHDDHRPAEVALLEGYVTAVGKNKFLNLRGRELNDQANSNTNRPWMLALYVAGLNSLEIRLFSDSKVKTLIESKELQGSVSKGENTEQIKVTTPSTNLLSLITEKGPGAFIDNDSITHQFKRAKK
ncbi:MAG: hypothetical protein WCN95_09540 [bacterium]